VSRICSARYDLLAFDEIHSDDLVARRGDNESKVEGRRRDKRETRICVERDGNVGIFDPQHRMIEL
jgi:hypothetical protein